MAKQKYYPFPNNSNEYKWITEQSRTLFDLRHSNRFIGPGSYDADSPLPRNFHSNNHSQFNSWRLFDSASPPTSPNNCEEPGPGTYNITRPIKKLNGVVWHKPTPLRVIPIKEEPIIMSEQIPQQTDNQQQISTKSKQILSAFASKIQRFPNIQKNKVGPGSYDVGYRIKEKSKSKRIVMKKPIILRSVTKKKRRQVGPTSYDLWVTTLESQVQKKGCAVSRESRFHYKRKPLQSTPGPGQYCLPRKKSSQIMQLISRLRVKTSF